MSNYYTVVMNDQQNNSLGSCWLLKLEDRYGELLEEVLYPMSDRTGIEAFDKFINDYVAAYGAVDDFEAMYISNLADDVDDYIDKVNVFGYEPEYAVEYHWMHSGIHHLIIFDSEAQADISFETLEGGPSEGQSDEDFYALAANRSLRDIEIDYRDVEWDDRHHVWKWSDSLNTRAIEVVNVAHRVPYLY